MAVTSLGFTLLLWSISDFLSSLQFSWIHILAIVEKQNQLLWELICGSEQNITLFTLFNTVLQINSLLYIYVLKSGLPSHFAFCKLRLWYNLFWASPPCASSSLLPPDREMKHFDPHREIGRMLWFHTDPSWAHLPAEACIGSDTWCPGHRRQRWVDFFKNWKFHFEIWCSVCGLTLILLPHFHLNKFCTSDEGGVNCTEEYLNT